MKDFPFRRRGVRRPQLFFIVLLSLAAVSCRKPPRPGGGTQAEAVESQAAVPANALAGVPGKLYSLVADSPVRWQPWTPEALKMAESSNRLVFGLIVMPQQPGFQEILAELDADPARVEAINRNYVPVLIDGDACREMALLTAHLCAELKQGISLPLMVWFTPAGDPVAWRGATGSSAPFRELFNQSHSMVEGMWKDDPDYVRENSRANNNDRRARMSRRAALTKASDQPVQDTLTGIRQLSALYDPVSRSLDQAGGLFPAGALDLLSTAAAHPGIPDEIRRRCLETIGELMEDILPSAMFDPLDGGVFTSRRHGTWDFPVFSRDCPTQARVALALFHMYRATGEPLALERALGLLAFAERSYRTPGGLFSLGVEKSWETEDWLWQVEDVKKVLPPEDAAWWIKATRMHDLGNLPSEADPGRKFFRANTIGLPSGMAGIAAGAGIGPEEFAPRYEAVRKLLLEARGKRLGGSFKDEVPHAISTFRMVSAHAAAFTATGEEKWRETAVELLAAARAAFGDGPRLRQFDREGPVTITGARAFVYALAIQSGLDVASITSDESWTDWAVNLTTTAAELFATEGYLAESSPATKVIDLPIGDFAMLFDDSTLGLFASATARLEALEKPVVPGLLEISRPLPASVASRPILHTDNLLAALSRHHGVTVLAGAGLSPEMKLAVERLPLRTFHRRSAGTGDEVPAGSVKIFVPGLDPVTVEDVHLLREALLPSGEKQ